MIDVSVIIPCFNHAATLPRAVESALLQTGVAEIIVVDDASTDHSVGVAQELCARSGRVQLHQLAKNSGPGATRNCGVAKASGSHIVFLDADDELLGDFTGSAIALFEKNPGLIVAKCEVEFLDPVKGYILPPQDPRHAAAILSSSCGMLMKRAHFLGMGGFSENPVFRGPMGGEDVAFMQAVMAHFQPIARVEQVGYRVWSCAGSHLDRFLAMTRLTASGSFEFVARQTLQGDADKLEEAVRLYLREVDIAVSNFINSDKR